MTSVYEPLDFSTHQWSDTDFTSKSPFLTPMPLEPLDTIDSAESDPESRIDSLEQSFCSNFSCCGLVIADLHQLLDHLDACHSDATDNGDSSPCVSDSLSDIDPLSPLTDDEPMQTDSPIHEPACRLLPNCPHTTSIPRSPAQLDLLDIPELDSSASSSPSPASSTLPSPNPSEPMCLPPSLLIAHHQPTAAARKSSPRSPQGKWVSGASRQRARVAAHNAEVGRAARVVLAPASPAQARRREREKAYKCPHPGCTKSYLNPNGLKYHLEKGTCTITLPIADPAPARVQVLELFPHAVTSPVDPAERHQGPGFDRGAQ